MSVSSGKKALDEDADHYPGRIVTQNGVEFPNKLYRFFNGVDFSVVNEPVGVDPPKFADIAAFDGL